LEGDGKEEVEGDGKLERCTGMEMATTVRRVGCVTNGIASPSAGARTENDAEAMGVLMGVLLGVLTEDVPSAWNCGASCL